MNMIDNDYHYEQCHDNYEKFLYYCETIASEYEFDLDDAFVSQQAEIMLERNNTAIIH